MYIFVYTAIIFLVFVRETTKMSYLSCQVNQIIHLFNIVYTCLSLQQQHSLLSQASWGRLTLVYHCLTLIAAPPGPPAIHSCTLEETMDPGKQQTDVGASDDDDSDEDYVDSEEGETSDDEVC
jgi:hypothetical protein